ncbi:unnamed protein product [Leptidea sinapis]|uniref:Uncharacterized protein n=1 Tax=Leptidea sinapis TaxID=189913 RepID=A0A5E4Q3B0_9NEOP|nr:unnamed protein product [Leptidea sinapis]
MYMYSFVSFILEKVTKQVAHFMEVTSYNDQKPTTTQPSERGAGYSIHIGQSLHITIGWVVVCDILPVQRYQSANNLLNYLGSQTDEKAKMAAIWLPSDPTPTYQDVLSSSRPRLWKK